MTEWVFWVCNRTTWRCRFSCKNQQSALTGPTGISIVQWASWSFVQEAFSVILYATQIVSSNSGWRRSSRRKKKLSSSSSSSGSRVILDYCRPGPTNYRIWQLLGDPCAALLDFQTAVRDKPGLLRAESVQQQQDLLLNCPAK